ncbi:MAG: hypothetical protein V4568_06280 [Pseudomonadota bacterium]
MSTHYFHRLYGLSIQSPFPLPGAPNLTAPVASVDVTLLWKPETEWDADRWRVTQASSGPARPEIGEADDGSAYLAWGDELKIAINAQRDEVCVVSRAAKLEFAPTVIVGFVLGYLLHLRGVLCLHGAVLEREGRAIAVLGDSGAGKSTIAAALVKNGARLLSDDLLVIPHTDRGVFVHSGCIGLRLTSNSASHLFAGNEDGLGHVPWLDKKLWDMSGIADEHCFQALPLAALYLLESDDGAEDVTMEPPLPPSAALQRLIPAWYPPENLRLLTQERLRHIQLVAKEVPLHVVRYVKQWQHLPRVIDLLNA